MTATAALIFEWASERRIRRRRDDRSYGGPDVHWAIEWGKYCGERGICHPDAIFEVMDRAKQRRTAASSGDFGTTSTNKSSTQPNGTLLRVSTRRHPNRLRRTA